MRKRRQQRQPTRKYIATVSNAFGNSDCYQFIEPGNVTVAQVRGEQSAADENAVGKLATLFQRCSQKLCMPPQTFLKRRFVISHHVNRQRAFASKYVLQANLW